MTAYDWPGNVRQLEKVMECLVAFGRLPDLVRRSGRAGEVAGKNVAAVVARHDGQVAAAARELGVSRQTVYRRMKRSG